MYYEYYQELTRKILGDTRFKEIYKKDVKEFVWECGKFVAQQVEDPYFKFKDNELNQDFFVRLTIFLINELRKEKLKFQNFQKKINIIIDPKNYHTLNYQALYSNYQLIFDYISKIKEED